ncbi:unnamed protein product, partial [Acanthoscelides obtectus]
LLSVFGNEAPHQSTISRWCGEFKRGRVSLSDDPRVGVPKTAVTQEHVDAIEASLKISKTSIQKILHKELGVRILVSRWIPHLLTEEQKAARFNWCQKTLDRFNSGNSKNVYSIVSGDESWIYCYEPENKRQSVMVATFYLTEENVELLDHPPYSPDLKEAVDAFKNAVLDLPANEWNKCFENWYERMQMCGINLRGKYFEKQ